LTKKLSEKDKKDWQNFLNSSEKLENKDKNISSKNRRIEEKIIDLHGFTLEEANIKISDFIVDCYEKNVVKINIITGKGLRSKNLDDPYQSQNLSILKHSVPNFIKNDPNLMSKIIKIDFVSVNSPSKGNFDIFLKKKF
jgi:DNA-nicking Smr family endonuclease